MPPRSHPILCLCEAHQISTVPLPRIAYQSLCIPSIALPSLCFATQLQVMPSLHTAVEALAELYAVAQRHCYALQHHAVAVQYLSSPLAVMPLPRDTLRFIAYPLLLCAFRGFSSALVAYRCLRCESCCPRCGSLHCFAFPLLCRSEPRAATPLLVVAKPSRAFALTRALRM